MAVETAHDPGVVQLNALRVIEQAWLHLREHDFSSFLGLLSDDIVWHVPAMPGVPFAGTWFGIDGVKEFFDIVADAQESISFEPQRFIADSNTVVVLGHFINRVRSTDRQSCSDWAQVWTVANGRICAMREYVDTLSVSRAFDAGDPSQPSNQD